MNTSLLWWNTAPNGWKYSPMRTAKAPQVTRILVEEVFTRCGTPAYLVFD